MPESDPEPASDPLALEGVGHRYTPPAGGRRRRRGSAPDAPPEVVRGIDLAVPPRALVALLGASGSGKSTVLRAVAGFVTPTAGRIRIGGELVAGGGREIVAAERRRVGMVFQDYALFPHMSVADNIGFGLVGRPGRRQRVADLLTLVELEALAERRPPTLSGGQQQRVALARALAAEPKVLLLDEPFANLDAGLRAVLGDEVRRVLAAEGTAGLLVTHDRREAFALADQVAVLAPEAPGGPRRIVQVGTPEEVYRRPVSAQVAELTGDAILVPAEVRGLEADTPLGRLPLRAAAPDGARRVVVRPEQLAFEPGPGGGARVARVGFEGATWRLTVRGPAGSLDVGLRAESAPAVGVEGRVHVLGAVTAVP